MQRLRLVVAYTSLLVSHNGLTCFQWIMDLLIQEKQLTETYAYLEDVNMTQMTQKDHGANLKKKEKLKSQ